MFVAAFTKEIPDYGDPTTNKAESMFANIKRLIRQYFGETRPGPFLLYYFKYQRYFNRSDYLSADLCVCLSV